MALVYFNNVFFCGSIHLEICRVKGKQEKPTNMPALTSIKYIHGCPQNFLQGVGASLKRPPMWKIKAPHKEKKDQPRRNICFLFPGGRLLLPSPSPPPPPLRAPIHIISVFFAYILLHTTNFAYFASMPKRKV